MTNPIRITAEVEGAEAALEMAAMLDELSGAVAAFETREAEGKNPALWRVEAYPRELVVNAETEIRLALTAPGSRRRPRSVGEGPVPTPGSAGANPRELPPHGTR